MTSGIKFNSLFVPQALRETGVSSIAYDGQDFFVINKESSKKVQRAFLSADLREISAKSLEKYLSHGSLVLGKTVSKAGDEYTVRFNGRLNGGGPFGALFVYVAANVAGVAITLAGAMTANPVIIAAGVATITAAPYTLIVTLPAPTP